MSKFKLVRTESVKENNVAYGIKDNKGVLIWLPKTKTRKEQGHFGQINLIIPDWLAKEIDTLEYEDVD